jgi:prepilin-type N-terminal cleavage/methylation domain-containing protein
MKKGFTLIELIISIVIIGIASASIPIMMSAANKLQEQTINQDVYFKSVTVMTDILSKYWDNADSVDSNINIDEKDIGLIWNARNTDTTDARDASLDRPIRIGSVQNNNYRYFYRNNDTNASPVDASMISNAIQHKIYIDTTTPANSTSFAYINQYGGGYIDEVNDDSKVKYDVKVEYVPDVVATPNPNKQTATWSLSGGNSWTTAIGSTNLKRITITATRTAGSETMSTSFVYFSSNIGTPGLKVQ